MKDNTNKNYWQRIAKIYAPLMEKDKNFYESIAQEIIPYLNKEMNVLELACGSGQLSFTLAEFAAKWTATDYSPNMVLEAQKRGEKDSLIFEEADATDLSYENESFDFVLIANALHIMPSPEKAMEEIKRILKNNGLLCAPTFLWQEGKYNKLKRKIMELSGFKTYQEWDRNSFGRFVESFGFKLINIEIVCGGIVPVGVLVARKS